MSDCHRVLICYCTDSFWQLCSCHPSTSLSTKNRPCHLHDRDECVYPRYHPISGKARNSRLYNKKTILFHFHPSATSFDTFVDFSAPPLSVKCGIQNTSNGFIVTSFSRKCKGQERLLETDSVFF